MFFRVLAAMVTADALDRHMRRQQQRAWLAAQQRHQSAQTPPAGGPWPTAQSTASSQPTPTQTT